MPSGFDTNDPAVLASLDNITKTKSLGIRPRLWACLEVGRYSNFARQCPLWVISGHRGLAFDICPFSEGLQKPDCP
jgi:hypothetical protein